MNDRLPSLPIEARERNPYRSLYAALLLQNVQDAISDALSDGDSQDSGDGEGSAPSPPSSLWHIVHGGEAGVDLFDGGPDSGHTSRAFSLSNRHSSEGTLPL